MKGPHVFCAVQAGGAMALGLEMLAPGSHCQQVS
jgi:hypothetical protein